MRYKKEENRPYRRYKHTAEEQKAIRAKGFTPVVSSNVSAIAREGKILYVRFLDSATYAYPRSGKLFDEMLNSKSKGKFVWSELIRKRVPYRKANAKAFKLGTEIEKQAPRNLMDEARAKQQEAKKPALKTILTGLALSTLISKDNVLKQGIITSLLQVSKINSNATINAE